MVRKLSTNRQWMLKLAMAVAVLTVMIVLLPTEAQAASESDLTFILNSDGQSYSVSGCNPSASGSLTIPATYNGKPVTFIGTRAFYKYESLTSVTIPNSVVVLGSEAFEGCTHLVSVALPNSLASIESDAFNYCFRLESITIPDGVYKIGARAFCDCFSLSSINIPNSVTRIDRYAFWLCSGLTSITIPGSVTSIGEGAFLECNKLTSVTISNGVTSIGDRAFYKCESLESISVPESVTSIGSEAFAKCKKLRKVAVFSKTVMFSEFVFEDTAGYNLSLYGHNDSTTETYANTNHHKFVKIEELGDVPNSTTPPSQEPPNSTDKALTSVDYLAFSQLAYLDWEPGQTVEGRISKNKLINDESDSNITYGMLCKNILDWKVIATSNNGMNYEIGFYAVTFCNENTKQIVVAYRGSKNLIKISSSVDAINDWLSNDVPFQVFHTYTAQLKNATDYYTYIKNVVPSNYTLTVTGHSLGGALAETVSMTYGVYGEVFNAASVFEALYLNQPEIIGLNFTGVNNWNFVAHVNSEDAWVGMYLGEYADLPFIFHDNTKQSGAHSLLSLLVFDEIKGEIHMSNEEDDPKEPKAFSKDGWNYEPTLKFGTSSDDKIIHGAVADNGCIMYGGNGNDELFAHGKGDDIIIGGKGDDIIIGGCGNDTYIYYKGDGVDYIYDIAGGDCVKILGLYDTDVLGWYDDPRGYKVVTLQEDKSAEAVPILYISTNRDRSQHCSFSVESEDDLFFVVIGGWDNLYSAYVACPVDVDILDADGIIVMTLKNGITMAEHTAYGNFYVFEDENGESCKRFDIVEGYSAKIRGIGEGTMNIAVLHDGKNPTTDSVGAENITVTKSTTATFKFEQGKQAVLLVNDGTNQKEFSLQKQINITLDAGEGICHISSVKTDYTGVVIELPIPVREGYTFFGWKKDDGTVVSAGDTLDADVTLYAAWNAEEHSTEPSTEPNEPATPTEPQNKEKQNNDSDNKAFWVLIVVACLAAGAVAWIVISKKSSAK